MENGSDALASKIQVIAETEDFLVVDKPSGLPVHADGLRSDYTLTDWIVRRVPEAANVGEPLVLKDGTTILRPGIVHRLDKDTSGVMIVAKTQEFFDYLKGEFQERRVSKLYVAFVYGIIKEEKGTIDFSIGRSRKDFRLRSAQPKAKGNLREAITQYRVLARGPKHTYLEVMPKTGRMHQIRVHMKAIHHPIICDRLYAPNQSGDLGFGRLALHAKEIAFHLKNGEEVRFVSDLPPMFEAAKQELGAP